ncbi:hypothetical protein GCM10027275_30130 [Rhabdobacter roseus]|uniref:Uncharacterized protein n=1 Tax=Rhabdobacter roseus TaxID=1655419 RepID=A0A840TYK5_9BACT|nr:hypothetical protein [Rhabdobacter roseus]MBB5284970.1 hypothetical protein [Rhabdobacter roseus]
MKIAFVVSFFDFRNDVRRVIAEVAAQQEVVVFSKAEQAGVIQKYIPPQVEFRLIQERQSTPWNRFWERFYLLFKRLPQSRSNFFLMELFKVSNNPDPVQQAKGRRLLQWIQRLPKFLSYDTYLRQLRYQQGTLLDDIDHFICFTAIADDYLLARLIREKKAVRVYVYSWDHPCKHTCFSKKVKYLCWSEGIRADVVSLQGIEPAQVKVLGASQFGYINEYKRHAPMPAPKYPFPYVYFGCAIGITDLVPDELRRVKVLAQVLAQAQPTWRLVVRPYPVLTNWTYYEELRQLPNLVLDDDFRGSDTSVSEVHIHQKYATIEQAEAFFHLGTTMGLEACFTGTPSFILDFGYSTQEGLSLYNFIHQYQNDRHLINLAPQNAVKSEEALRAVLEDPTQPKYQELNQLVQQQYPLKSFTELVQGLI